MRTTTLVKIGSIGSFALLLAIAGQTHAQPKPAGAAPPPAAPAPVPPAAPAPAPEAAPAPAPEAAPAPAPEAAPAAAPEAAAAPDASLQATTNTPPAPDSASPSDSGPGPKKFAIEFGAGVGLDIPTGGLGLGPGFFVEAGGRLLLGPGMLALALRGGYEQFSASGKGQLACPATPTATDAPCIASNNGSYDWELTEQTVIIGLPISYRLLPNSRLHPYAGIVPQVFLLKATTTAYGLENSQGDTKFGVAFLLGAQFDLGPGGIFFDAGYQYAGLDHRLTGKSNIGAVTTALGYRVAL